MSPDRKPFQFSVRQLLAVFLALCVALALVTQLWHVGFVLALLLGGIAAGAWRRDWRLTAAATTALLIFIATYGASWLQWGDSPRLDDRRQHLTMIQLNWAEDVLVEHARSHGEPPESLDDVPELKSTTDMWGHPFYYRKIGKENFAFELASLGQDGKPGGTDLNTDLFVGGVVRTPWKRLSLWQFVFETHASGSIFLLGTAASLVTASLWYAAQRKECPAGERVIISVGITTIAAVIVSVFLAGVHIALSQSSGH